MDPRLSQELAPMTQDERAFFMAINARIAELREASSITQVADKMGVSRQTVAVDAARARARSACPRGLNRPELPPAAKRGPIPKLQRRLKRISALPKRKQRRDGTAQGDDKAVNARVKLFQGVIVGVFTTFMASIGFAQAPSAPSKFPSGKISVEQLKELQRYVASKPGVRKAEDDVVTRFELPAERTIYFFSKPGHPAHPCVVIRAVVDDGQRIQVRTVGHYAGSQEAFDQWYRAFLASDERIRP